VKPSGQEKNRAKSVSNAATLATRESRDIVADGASRTDSPLPHRDEPSVIPFPSLPFPSLCLVLKKGTSWTGHIPESYLPLVTGEKYPNTGWERYVLCKHSDAHRYFAIYFSNPCFRVLGRALCACTETPVKAAMHRMLALSIITHVARLILGQA